MEFLSLDDITKRVAETLKIVAEGQGMRARDGSVIEDAYGDILATLKQDGVINIHVNETPRYLAIPLTLLCAAASAEGCNAVNPDAHKRNAIGAEAEIRRLTYKRDDSGTRDVELYI